MAILSNTATAHGVDLPYSRLTKVSVDDKNMTVHVGRSSGQGERSLVVKRLTINSDVSKLISDELLTVAYNRLKEFGLISGDDC